MGKNSIVIPDGVVNPKEYQKMVALERNPVLKNVIYVTSDGDEVNISWLPHYLRKRIEHLSPKEQDDIFELKRRYLQLRAKISTAKSLAYGRAGCYGGKKKEDIAQWRISPFEEDVIELLGRLFTISEVVRIMFEENHIEVTEDDVKGVLKKHIGEIEKKREDFRNKVADVRLYNKRPRLEELAWMYSSMKMRYIALNSNDAYNSMLRTLEQIRKEAEGDVININGSVEINVEATIQNHIQKEVLKTINLKEIILGRIAARMNYDVNKLISSLHNSYYAKFIEISGQMDLDAKMNYPSQSQYDFTAIERSAGNDVIDIKAEDVTEKEKSTAVNVKQLFLDKIKKQKKEIESRQAVWNAEAEDNRPTSKDDVGSVNRGSRNFDKNLPSKKKKNKDKEYFTGDKKK